MWYEILPTLGLIYGFLALPPYATLAMNKLSSGKSCGRYWEKHSQDFHVYLRDQRITGSEYVPRGLEGVPSME